MGRPRTLGKEVRSWIGLPVGRWLTGVSPVVLIFGSLT
jgi:hypothetical protein